MANSRPYAFTEGRERSRCSRIENLRRWRTRRPFRGVRGFRYGDSPVDSPAEHADSPGSSHCPRRERQVLRDRRSKREPALAQYGRVRSDYQHLASACTDSNAAWRSGQRCYLGSDLCVWRRRSHRDARSHISPERGVRSGYRSLAKPSFHAYTAPRLLRREPRWTYFPGGRRPSGRR